MIKQNKYLLIGGKSGSWKDALSQAINDGYVETIDQDALHTLEFDTQPNLYIIDNTYIEDVPYVIRYIRRQNRLARIVVVSLSPSWQRARDALHAGAIDYIKKSIDKASISEWVSIALHKMLPP